MSVYVNGGGSGNGTVYESQMDAQTITLFTTPNEDNTVFLVDYTWGASLGDGAFGTVDTELNTLAGNMPQEAIKGKGRIRVGQNTAVKISVPCLNSGSSAPIAYSYNYVKLVIDTN